MIYLLDSNIFITPHRTFAPIDVAVSLWAKFKDFADSAIISSIDKVKDELYLHDDELKTWMVENVASSFFLPFENDDTLARLANIINWAASNPQYSQKAKDKFMRMDKADIYLIAYASVQPSDYTIVSFERSNHFGSGEIKLPDVCTQFGVRCIPLEMMFRELKETF